MTPERPPSYTALVVEKDQYHRVGIGNILYERGFSRVISTDFPGEVALLIKKHPISLAIIDSDRYPDQAQYLQDHDIPVLPPPPPNELERFEGQVNIIFSSLS